MRLPYLIGLVYISAFLNPYTAHAEGSAKPNGYGQLVYEGRVIPDPLSGYVSGAGYGNVHPGGGATFGGQTVTGVSGYQPPVPAAAPPLPACPPVNQALVAEYQGLVARYASIEGQTAEVAIDKYERYEQRANELAGQVGAGCQAPGLAEARASNLAYLNQHFPGWNTVKQHTNIRREQVRAIGHQIDERLQEGSVTRRLSPTLVNHIRVERNSIEAISRDARNIVASSNRYYRTAQMVADYAYFTATSVNNFLGGVAMGIYDDAAESIASAQRISQMIYNDRDAAGLIAERIVHTMMRPEVIAAAVRDSFTRYSTSMAQGNYRQAGREFSHVVLQTLPLVSPAAVVGDAAVTATREVVHNLHHHFMVNPAARQATNQGFYTALTSNAAVREEWGAIQQEMNLHSPINPGRLSEIPIDRTIPLVAGDQNSVASTFRSATYTRHVLTEPMTMSRWQQRDARLGRYFSPEARPQLQAIIDHAIAPRWQEAVDGGMGQLVLHEVELPVGTTIYRGPAAPQGGVVGSAFALDAALVGGGEQIFVEDLTHARIIRSE